ncbi:MAG TPA: hypothetical protein VOB72_22645 [Candidatus Dormibacteraeota bacterium]|nr:hypothetical protein [Candidatus Dormibacteraeota bacterium]
MSKKRRSTAPPPAAPASRRRPPPRRRTGPPEWVLPVGMAVAGLLLLTAVVFGIVLFSRGTPSASASPTATGQTIDGVQCQAQEQALFHIHAHLAIYADGQPRTVPAQIGIPGTCLYWLHSHDTDGVIHVESPVQRTYTLGNWFDIWGQPLSATQAGSDKGTVTAYVNGQRYTGDPRDIPLTAHAVIQLDVGTDIAPKPYTFANGL